MQYIHVNIRISTFVLLLKPQVPMLNVSQSSRKACSQPVCWKSTITESSEGFPAVHTHQSSTKQNLIETACHLHPFQPLRTLSWWFVVGRLCYEADILCFSLVSQMTHSISAHSLWSFPFWWNPLQMMAHLHKQVHTPSFHNPMGRW